MIRIAFVASTFVIGGAERVTAEVITRLARDRFEPNLYFLRDAGPVGRELMEQGIRSMQWLERGGGVRALGRLGRHFARRRPDVVFCLDHRNAMWWGRWAGILCRARGIAVASHATGLVGRRGAFGPEARLLMPFTDRVVALSETHASYLAAREGVPRGQIAVIENGIDLDRYARRNGIGHEVRAELGIPETSGVVVMVAALRPEKAHEALLGAAAALHGRPVEFVIAGDGPRRAELESLAATLGVSDRVRFLGARGDVARLLQAADVAVLPSRDVVETLPLAVLEAMATGVPVVASRVGSLPEVIRDRETGILIPPADPLALSAGIEYILDNRAAAAAMARGATETVRQRYSAERMVAQYADMFSQLAA